MRLEQFTLDVRHALRSLAAAGNRAFALASIATLALAIAAVTAIVSIAWGMLFAPLPYENAERVVHLRDRNPSRGLPSFSVSGPNLQSWRERLTSFGSVAGFTSESANIGVAGETQRFEVVTVSPEFWSTIGIAPIAGRAFAAEEAVFPGKPVAMLSERVAADRFGNASRAIGQTIAINGTTHQVIGVVPQDVGFSTSLELWVPLVLDPEIYTRGDRRLQVIGRLADGATIDSARAELATVSAALAKEFPEENAGWEGAIQPIRDWIVGPDAERRILTLLAAVAVLMLVAAGNVASLQLARATRRSREIGVRQALGAARSRLLAQLATENLVLVAIAAIAGIVLAAAMLALAVANLPAATPRLAHFTLDARVAAAATFVMAVLTIAFGLLPALVGRGASVTNALAQGGRTTADASRMSMRQVLVVAQFTFSTVLLVGAVLLAQELIRIRDATLGFTADRLLVARMTMPMATDADYTVGMQRYDALLQRLRALPGVESVAIASEIPLGEFDTSFDIAAGTGKLTYVDDATNAAWRVVSPDYFRTLGVPLLRGTTFTSSPPRGVRPVILSAGLSEKLFGDTDPVGQSVKLGNGQNAIVAGVAGDALQRDLAEAPTPTMYFPTTWILLPTMNVAVRAAGDPGALVGAVREAAKEVAPEFPLFDLGTMRSVVESSIAQPKLQTAVLVGFAGASLALAAIGIAGLLAFLVASRTPELALRLALGASGRNVTGLVLTRGGALCAMGLAAGAIVSVAAIGKVKPDVADASMTQALLIAVAVLATVAFAACWLPARRVTRINPSLALRGE